MAESTRFKANGWDYGFCLRRSRIHEGEVTWLNRNVGTGGWFYTWEPGMVNRVICFKHEEDLMLFKVAYGDPA